MHVRNPREGLGGEQSLSRGAGGQGATGQAFPFDFGCVCPETGGSLQERRDAGEATVQNDIAFSRFNEEGVSRSMYRTGSPGKQELIQQHWFVSCPGASSANRVWGIFLGCSSGGSVPGSEHGQGQL